MTFNFGSGMTGFRVRRQKFGFGSLLFLMAFGAVFTLAGVFGLKSTKIDQSWTRVTGTVVDSSSNVSDGSTTYTPVVTYEVNGQTYRVTSNIGTGTYPPIGERQEVAYDPQRPAEAKVVNDASKTWFIYLFPVVGISCLLIAPIQFVRSTRRGSSIKRLTQSGQKLQGILTDVQSGAGNNSSYKIVVSATGPSGTVQNFVSDTLTGIGGLALTDFRSNPIPIDVYIDPSNPDNYYVDASEVPNLTPERIGQLIQSVAHKQPSTFAQGEQPSQIPLTAAPDQPVMAPQPAQTPPGGIGRPGSTIP